MLRDYVRVGGVEKASASIWIVLFDFLGHMYRHRVVGTLISLGSCCMSKTSVFGFVQISRTGGGCRPASTMARAAANASPPQQQHHHGLRRNLYTNARHFLGRTAIPQRGEITCSRATATDRCTNSRTRRSTSAALTVALLSCSWSGSAGAHIPSGWTVGGGGSRGSRPSHSVSLPMSSSLSAGGAAAAAAAPVTTSVGDDVEAIKPPVIFVLGGPGSGKGTQCERLAKDFGYIHLSAGELLRQERESGSSDGQLIDEYIREGRIVPVAISLGLLRRAMDESAPFSRFLIDGFPRNRDNVQGWDDIMGDVADVRCVLFLHCPEDVLEKRLLLRGKSSGRTDDNVETARRRFQTYVETTLPVVEQFEREGMVARVNGNQDIQTVFRDVLAALKPVQEKEVLDANRAALAAASAGDWTAYAELCSPDITKLTAGSKSESSGSGDDGIGSNPSMARTLVRMLNGGAAAVVSYERLLCSGERGSGDASDATTVQETRVWEVREGRWKCVHCHTSPCEGSGDEASATR